MEQTHVKIF